MSKPFISLCPEITRANALDLMDWLKDENVVRYLSDSRHVSRHIEQVVSWVQLPVLTHLFNQSGRFFMACDRHDRPVGFVRLVKNGADCEIVLVIGDRENWGRRLGASALREGMKLAFFDMRAEKLIARIHADNTRSLKAFLRCGFVLESETPTLKSFAMSWERYLQRLRDNIALADPGASMDAVVQAAKLAGAHEFILELPEGYDTLVGEQGSTLSGGQRQRIAIARALMTNLRVLIFDEATSALDYESERIVHDNMRFICKGRTVIIIAHRLSAVRDAHRIVVMEAGEIVEQGTHAELLATPGGRYAHLHALQAG